MAIALDLDSLDAETKALINRLCITRPNKSQYDDDPPPITCYAVSEDRVVYLPLGRWRAFLAEFPQWELPATDFVCKKKPLTVTNPPPRGTILDPKGTRDQDQVFPEALSLLRKNHYAFISAFPGFGKTTCGNWLAARLGVKTLVVCHISKVCAQWVAEFRNHSTARVQLITGSVPLDPEADVYVVGVTKLTTIPREDLTGIGFVIYDEAHISTTTACSRSLLRVQPKYLLGLSATPKRPDGLHRLLEMYFGKLKNAIYRHEVKDFVVYKVETPYKPKLRYTLVRGRPTPVWTDVITSLSEYEERRDYIAGLCLENPDRRIMVLSDRVDECEAIFAKLESAGESVLLISGTKKIREDTTRYRILVTSRKKGGTGFDDPTLTMLILCTDCVTVNQFEGRIRTTNNIVYDLVDDYRTLESHWKTRAEWYRARGAEIKTISLRGEAVAVAETPPPMRRLLPRNLASAIT